MSILYDSSVSVMNMSYLFKLLPPQNENKRYFTMHVLIYVSVLVKNMQNKTSYCQY